MVDPKASDRTSNPANLNPEKYARLKAEAAAPYRGLRQFVYFACGASGFIGAFIFLAQIAAGREVSTALPNFGLQIGVVALMVWLFRLEQKASRKSIKK
jgi:Low psii accumulation1 / Rep27